MANCKKPQNHSEPPPKSIQLSRLRSFTLASSMDAKAPTIPITPVKHAIVNRILGILIADLLGHLSSLAGHRRRTLGASPAPGREPRCPSAGPVLGAP